MKIQGAVSIRVVLLYLQPVRCARVGPCSTTSPSSAPTPAPAPPSTTPSWPRSADAGHGIRRVVGFGVPPQPDFWVGPPTDRRRVRECHIAFTPPDRAAVRAFFDAAIAVGAEVLHPTRLWPEYHPNYYGAFVRDPDGNNVEAVCHAPE